MNIKWAQHVQELLKRGRPEDLVQSLETPREQKTSFQRALSRRNFVRTAAGAAGAGAVLGSSSLLLPRRVFADDDHDRGFPNPIPHVTPVGPGVHFYFPGPVSGVAAPTDPTGVHAEGRDPSTIYDFCGVIGGCDVNGKATGINTLTDATTAYDYHADLRFMAGRFIGTDGHNHEGTLAFIWLDTTGPVGPPPHSYDPGIAANGLFWTTFIPRHRGGVHVHLADGEAVLDAQNIAVFDWGTIPNSLAHGAHVDASVSLRIIWYGRGTQVPFSSAAAMFKGAYSVNKVVVRAIARTPSQNLKLVTDPLSTVTNFAQIGSESNGFFFTHECEEEEDEDRD